MKYAARIEVDLDADSEDAAEQETQDIAVVSAGKLATLLNIIDGHQPPEGQTISSAIEAVRSDLEQNYDTGRSPKGYQSQRSCHKVR